MRWLPDMQKLRLRVKTAALADFVAQEGGGKLPVQVSLVCRAWLWGLSSPVRHAA